MGILIRQPKLTLVNKEVFMKKLRLTRFSFLFFSTFSAMVAGDAFSHEAQQSLFFQKNKNDLLLNAGNDFTLNISIYSVVSGEKKDIGNKMVHIGNKRKGDNFLFYEDNFLTHRYVSNVSTTTKNNPDNTDYIKKNVSYVDIPYGFSAHVSGYVYDKKGIMSRLKISAAFSVCSKKDYSYDNETLMELPDLNTHSSLIKSLNNINEKYTYLLQDGVLCNQYNEAKRLKGFMAMVPSDGVYLDITYSTN